MTTPNTNSSDLDREAFEAAIKAYREEDPYERYPDHRLCMTAAIRAWEAALPRASGVPEAEAVAWQVWHPEDGWAEIHKDNLEYYRELDFPVRPLFTSPPPVAVPSGEALRYAAQFLIDRLEDFELDETDAKEMCRQYLGFVEPAIDRLKMELVSPIASEPKNAGRGEGQEIAEQAAQFLWSLLDDIDTVGDHVKADNAAYRELADRIQRRRFEVGDTDGYTVTFKRKAEILTAPSGAKPGEVKP